MTNTAKSYFGVIASRGHEAEFRRILPVKMKELVEQGLFEPHDGSFRITEIGKQKLKELTIDKSDGR